MRLTATLAALALAGLVAAAPTGSSTDFCMGNGQVVTVGVWPAEVLHIALDSVFSGYWSIWIYAETNGQQGLQRGGVTLLGDADICQDYEDHDQGVF